MQIVIAPEIDELRPGLVPVALCSYPVLLLIADKYQVFGELRTYETLMIVCGRVDEVTNNLPGHPLAGYLTGQTLLLRDQQKAFSGTLDGFAKVGQQRFP